jgi:hypothetical protein
MLIDAQGQTAVVDTGALVSAASSTATRPNTTVGRGVALDVATSARTGTTEVRRRTVWPFVVLPLGALVVGIAAFAFLKVTDPAAEQHDLAGALLSADTSPTAPERTEVAPEATEPVAGRAAPPDEGTGGTEATAGAATAEPAVKPAPTETALPPIKRAPVSTPRRPPKKGPDASEKKPTDAWDPNSFGGRE